MRRTLRSLVVTAAAAPLVMLGVPALAGGPAGWRMVQEFGASYGYPQIGGVVALNARSAWLSGDTYMIQNAVFLAHWNGSRWSQVAVPRELTSTSAAVDSGPLAPSGASLWLFPRLSTQSQNRVYAARLTSRHWTLWRLRGALAIDGAAVFGASNVWAFGEGLLPPGWTGLNNGPSYAERYNGRTWRRVYLPGVPLEVQAFAPNNIWAYGPTNRTASRANQDYVAMHWNGRTWSTLAVPRMRFANGKLMFPAGFTVLKGNSLWVTEQFHCPTPGLCEPPQPPGILLAHWNGRRWVRVLESSSFELPAPESDGHGGLFIEAQTVKRPHFVFLHLTHGRLSELPPPATVANLSGPSPIPGTASYWGTGELQPGGGPFVGAVFKLGP